MSRRVYLCRKCGQPKKGHVCTATNDNSSDDEFDEKSPKKQKQPAPPIQYVWEYEDGHTFYLHNGVYNVTNTWTRLDDSDQTTMNVLYNTKKLGIAYPPVFTLDTNNNKYKIDFDLMIQENCRTGFKRRIRSQPGGELPPPATIVTTVTTSFAVPQPNQTTTPTPPSPTKSPKPTPPQLPPLLTDLSSMPNGVPTILDYFPGEYQSCPDYWSHNSLQAEKLPNGTMGQTLIPDSNCGREIRVMFNKSKGYNQFGITHIQVLGNMGKFNKYQATKDAMPFKNERWLWHGTSPNNLPQIIANGLDRDHSNSDRQVFGKGTYFALDASYSLADRYSQPCVFDGTQYKVLLLSRVLVGYSCRGQPQMTTPLLRSDNITKYDSMVDDTKHPTIFVLSSGSDNQKYTEFVLWLRHP